MKTNVDLYVHYGCGLTNPQKWINYDSTPTLRIQKTPFIGKWIARRFKNLVFPDNVLYGDIIKGLPVEKDSCKGVYCSHVLEHLALEDCRKALANTYTMLQMGGIFRMVMPDLACYVKRYAEGLANHDAQSAHRFMEETTLGIHKRPRGLKAQLVEMYGSYHHLWMWDEYSMTKQLQQSGFTNIRRCEMGDSSDEMFRLVEGSSRFIDHLAFECIK